MELSQALSQISEIHGYLARTEVYRGYRPFPILFSGAFALTAAALAGRVLHGDAGVSFVLYWVAVAVVSAFACTAEIAFAYLREDEYARRHTRQVVGQFAPCMLAGALVTAASLRVEAPLVSALPGVWAILFGLGIFASRPYLPREIGWVALFYVFAGGATVFLATGAPSSWAMGLVFGLGQAGGALVLHRNREREYEPA